MKSKTTSQKRCRDEFKKISTNRVALAADWTSGYGRFTSIRALPAGCVLVQDVRLNNIATRNELSKTAKKALIRAKKENMLNRSFIVINDMKSFNF